MKILDNFYNIDSFGLDLSDRSIKVAQIKKRDKKIYLYSHGRENIPSGIIEDGEIKNENETINLIKKSLANSKPVPIRSKFVVYSIPETKGFIRVMKLPVVNEDHIEEAIRYEAEQLFPIDVSESYIDWQVLSRSSKNFLEILVAVVPRRLVDSYSLVLKKAGLKPIAAEIESIAITRSLINQKQSTKPILIIDLGKDRTGFIIFRSPAVQFSASIPICGKEFDKAIMKKIGINEEKSEKLKEKCGLSFKGECKEVYKAIQPLLHELIKYINRLTDYYKEHHKEETDISKVIICGGEARMVGISSFLSLRIKKEIEKGNPWVNIISPNEKEIPPISIDKSLVFVTVLGLALREFEKN